MVYDKTACKVVIDAIEDEASAVPMYNELLDLLDKEGMLTPETEIVIEGIIAQEKGHKEYFERLKTDLQCHIFASAGRKVTEFKTR